jgi:hypothetical protein
MKSFKSAEKIIGSIKSLCNYALYELALGGDLFDFVITGALPEEMARMYLR